MIFGAAKLQVDIKEGGGGGGGSDLNVQLTLSEGKVNMSTALYVFSCSFISYHLQTYLASFCTSAFSIMNLAYVAFTYTTSAS